MRRPSALLEVAGVEAPWCITLFGAFQIELPPAPGGARTVVSRFRTHKTGALLAYLAYHRERTHSREDLADRIWPDLDPESARASLRTALSSLRRQLEPPGSPWVSMGGGLFRAERAGVCLNAEVVATDVFLFEQRIKEARALARAATADKPQDTRAEIPLLQSALELYRGELLEGHYDEWLLNERRRLIEVFCTASERLASLLGQAGDEAGALACARRAVSADPLREATHLLLMRLYAERGRYGEALRQWEEWERLAREELAARPSSAAFALADQIRRAEAQEAAVSSRVPAPSSLAGRGRGRPLPPLPDRVPAPPASVLVKVRDSDLPTVPPPTPAAPGRTLPQPLTAFFGREEETVRLERLLRSEGRGQPARLITLTGTGGTGKTRLALEVAAVCAAEFAGNIWFVPLADIAEACLIPRRISDALGLEPAAGREPLDQIADALRRAGRTTSGETVRKLLILDNFEQIAEEGIGAILALLRLVPDLVCLVTSRRRLALPGEQVVAVPPLPIPERGGGDSTLSPPERLRESPAVQLFVDRAQAAHPDFQVTARNAVAVADLCRALEGLPLAIELAAARAGVLTPAQMLDRLAQRFDLLTNRRAGGIRDHHRSLWATLDWSHRLLPPELARFFAHLTIFRGGWTVRAAEAVCGEPRALEYLTQLRVHSLVQVDDSEGLGASGEMRFRLFETVREFGWAQLTEEDRDDLARRHAAHMLAFTNMPASEQEGESRVLPLRIVDAPRWSALIRPDQENIRAALRFCLEDQRGLRDAESEASGPEGRHWIGIRLAATMGRYWWIGGHLAEGRRWLAEALPVCPDEDILVRGDLLYWAGVLAWAHIDFAAADEAFHAALADFRQVDSDRGIAMVLNGLGIVAIHEGKALQAIPLLEESLTRHRRCGNTPGESLALQNLGSAARALGKLDDAEAYQEECLRLCRTSGDTWGAATALYQLGLTHLKRGHGAIAKESQEESPLEKAFSLMTTAYDRYEAIGERWGCASALFYLGDIHLREGDLTAARTSAERSIDGFREIGNLPNLLRSLFLAHRVAVLEGDEIAARSFRKEAICLGREHADAVFPTAHAAAGLLLTDLAYFAQHQQRWKEAARLLGAAQGATNDTVSTFAERMEIERTTAAVRTALGEDAFTAAMSEGRNSTRAQLLAVIRVFCAPL